MLKSVFLASVAVAGLTSFATGASAQSSTPVMGAGTTANEAFIIQRGLLNSANVDQTGTNNKAGKLFTNVDLSVPNLSESNLNGVSNGAYTILQSGTFNDLKVSQGGSNNSVSTITGYRYGTPTIGANNGSFQQGFDNRVDSKQFGTNGVAQFQQLGDKNRAWIDAQTGSKNTYAGIFQFNGDSNRAGITQSYAADNAYAAIVQSGSYNQGSISQNGNTNYAALLQIGKFNDASITQTGSYVGAVGYQNGNGNYGSITQSANSANAAFAQIGNLNSVTIKQH